MTYFLYSGEKKNNTNKTNLGEKGQSWLISAFFYVFSAIFKDF
jgi:hypothetical protein